MWPPRQWPWHYYAWRLETYAGIPMHKVTWRTLVAFLRDPVHRRAFIRYLRWVGQMRRLQR